MMLQSSVLLCYVMTLATVWAAITDLTEDDKKAILKFHNGARAKENAATMPDLTWDDDLAKTAQAWTDKCTFAHQTRRTWGENIAMTTYPQPDNQAAADRMVNNWLSESKYNVNGTFTECCSQRSHSCCHLTQVLWSKTTTVGCGLSYCPTLHSGNREISKAMYLACYYNPPGNRPITKCEQDWRPFIPAK